MTDFNTADILNYSINQQPLKVGDAFDSIMRDKVSAMIDDHQGTFNQTVFSAPEDDDQLEFDLEDIEVDDDIADEDIEDVDLDIDDDFADLEDLEIDSDEEDTDEDA